MNTSTETTPAQQELLEACKAAWHFIVHGEDENGVHVDQADITDRLKEVIEKAQA